MIAADKNNITKVPSWFIIAALIIKFSFVFKMKMKPFCVELLISFCVFFSFHSEVRGFDYSNRQLNVFCPSSMIMEN